MAGRLADSWVARAAVALGLGAIGGALADAVNVPLAWMIGAMAATTVATVAGAPLAVPPRLRAVMVAVLGIMLGSAFTPELTAQVGRWLPSLSALALYGVVVTAALFVYFRRAAGYDRVTAYFSSVPGGLNEMVIAGAAAGGDVRTISLVHAARILLVVSMLPIWFILAEGYVRPGVGIAGAPWSEIPVPDLLLLAACAPVGAVAAQRIRLPAANLTGPMALSALVHVFGLTTSQPPVELIATAQIVVGAAIGARFAGVSARYLMHTLAVALGATLLMLMGTALFAAGLHLVTGLSVEALVLAFAPGGLAEMSLIALALGVDAAFVSTHHIARIIIVVIAAPLVQRWIARRDRTD